MQDMYRLHRMCKDGYLQVDSIEGVYIDIYG